MDIQYIYIYHIILGNKIFNFLLHDSFKKAIYIVKTESDKIEFFD